jgi:SnoaL-like domain
VPQGSLARQAVVRYLALINAKRYGEIASIFAEDAVFLAPTGDTIRGREAINEFYSAGLEKISPVSVWASSQVTEGNCCVIEISATLPDEPEDKPRTVVDHFTVDDAGEVVRMAVYLRPAEVINTRLRLGLADQS